MAGVPWAQGVDKFQSAAAETLCSWNSARHIFLANVSELFPAQTQHDIRERMRNPV